MLMFLLAMLYDVQSPSDDGTCSAHATEDSCLNRKSVFDSTVSYCQWQLADDLSSASCLYRDPVFSLKVILYISVIVAILTAVISYPSDIIFDLLSAPVADDAKAAAQDSAIKALGRRVSNVARRASNAAMSAVTAVKNKFIRNKYIVGTVTRKLPGDTEAAHALATASMTVIVENSRQSMVRRQLTRMRTYHESGGKYGVTIISDDDLSSASGSDADSSSESDFEGENKQRVESTNEASICKKIESALSFACCRNKVSPAEDLVIRDLLKLSEEINCQRRLLRPSEVDQFDTQWGLDPTGEFSQGERSVVSCLRRSRPGAEAIILDELKFVRNVSAEKARKLAIATDAHTGLEILHLFIIDLLGRGTPAAVIFETKAEEDFQHTKVVTRRTKHLAALALFGINLFFVYYSILTGFRKGTAWQQIFLLACIVQFIVEVLLFETMEVVWINCAIPVLVSDEVRRVGESIIDVVQELCANASSESRFFLNAPDYLFVSTSVAKHFPHLMESILVQAYQNHLPGELSHKWHVGSIARMQRRHHRRSLSLIGLFLRILQYLGTAPFVIHRMFVRFLQPFVLSGLLLLWQFIMSNVIFIVITVFLGLMVLIYGLFRRYHEKKLLEKTQNVAPVAAEYLHNTHTERDDREGYTHQLHLPHVFALQLPVSDLRQRKSLRHSQECSGDSKEAPDSDGNDESDLLSIMLSTNAHHAPSKKNSVKIMHSDRSTDSTESSEPEQRERSLLDSELSSLDLPAAALPMSCTAFSARAKSHVRVPHPIYASSNSKSSKSGGTVSSSSTSSSDSSHAPAPSFSGRLSGVAFASTPSEPVCNQQQDASESSSCWSMSDISAESLPMPP